MTEDIFKDLCLCGETTKVQFKEKFTSTPKDLLCPAPIRIFIFDNRVKIISPGALATLYTHLIHIF